MLTSTRICQHDDTVQHASVHLQATHLPSNRGDRLGRCFRMQRIRAELCRYHGLSVSRGCNRSSLLPRVHLLLVVLVSDIVPRESPIPYQELYRYKREELPFRISIFYSGYTLSSAFGGLIAAGIIGNMDGVAGYASWRWLFLIEGGATIVAAIPAYWLLPNYPTTTMWLTAEERALAAYRLALEADGEEDTVQGSVMKGLKQALVDPKVWLLVLIQSAAVMAMSFTYFFPSIVQTLGYPRVITLLITSPPYFAAFFFSLGNSYHSSKSNERGYHIIGAVLMAAVGQIIAVSTPNVGARLFAFHLCAMGAFSAFQVILSWVSSSIPRPKAKRAVSIALATACSNCLNIASSYLYPKSDAP